MTMQAEQGINRELGLGEAISKTFQVFRRDFAKGKEFVFHLIADRVSGFLFRLSQMSKINVFTARTIERSI